MTTDELRELLTLAARAMNLPVVFADEYGGSTEIDWYYPVGYDEDGDVQDWWNPAIDDGDCAEMCAALGIDSIWWDTYVRCEFDDIDADAQEYFRDHNNDRAAAWRMAALRVAAAIGKEMG